jgi:hypothetical protein
MSDNPPGNTTLPAGEYAIVDENGLLAVAGDGTPFVWLSKEHCEKILDSVNGCKIIRIDGTPNDFYQEQTLKILSTFQDAPPEKIGEGMLIRYHLGIIQCGKEVKQ